MPVRAGSLDELRKEGRLLTKVGDAAGRGVLGRRPRLGDRGPLPAHGLPAAPGHRRVRARHLPLAPRPLRPRHRVHPRSLGRRRPRLRGHRRRRRRARRARAAATIRSRTSSSGSTTASSTGLSLVLAKSVLGLARSRRSPPTRSCAAASTSAPATATAGGAPASPCSSRWRTCSPSLDAPTTARSRWCTGSRSSPATPATTRRASRCARSTTGGEIERVRLADVVPAVRRDPFGATPPSACSRPRSAEPGAIGDVERMMFAAVTDHVFIDGGHTIDFTNKAFEALGYVGPEVRTPTCCPRWCAAPPPRPGRSRAAPGAIRTISPC